MWVGAFAAILEKNLKKLFAYSSINQMGFLLIGAAANTASSLTASLNYLLIYVFMNIPLFIILLETFEKNIQRQLKYLTDLLWFATTNINYAVIFVIVVFSMAGIPPLVGFFGKFFLLLEAMTQSFYSLVFMGLLTTMLSTYYYLKIIKHLLFDKLFITNNFSINKKFEHQLAFFVWNKQKHTFELLISILFLIFGVLSLNILFSAQSGWWLSNFYYKNLLI